MAKLGKNALIMRGSEGKLKIERAKHAIPCISADSFRDIYLASLQLQRRKDYEGKKAVSPAKISR